MKPARIAVISLLAILAILVGVGIYLANSIVSGAQKERITALASQKLGVPVTLDSYGMDWGSLLRLQPAIILNGLKVQNPAGFPQRTMLDAPSVSLRVNLTSALSHSIQIESLTLQKTRVLIEALEKGPTNLETLINNLKRENAVLRAPAVQTAGFAASGDDMQISLSEIDIDDGIVAFASAAAPEPRDTLTNLDLAISEIRAGAPSKLDFSTNLYNGQNSNLKFHGVIGPLEGAGLPIDGTISSDLIITELPAEVRRRFLGTLIGAPSPESKAGLELTLKGDLYKTSSGNGKVSFSSLAIGEDPKNRLSLAGSAPLTVRAENLLSAGEVAIQSNNAKLNLGAGTWNGNVNVLQSERSLSGDISGAIRGVDVNQMLSSFAGSPDVVYGTLSVPQFKIAFRGDEPAAIQRSLNGSGNMQIDKGRFKGLSVLASIERALGGSPSGSGEFTTFQTAFAIQQQTIRLSGIDVAGPGINVAGNGTIAFNEALNFRLQSKLVGNAANLLKARTGGYVDNVVIPVTIAGTVSNPQVRPDISGLAKSATQDAIKNVFDRFLKPKK